MKNERVFYAAIAIFIAILTCVSLSIVGFTNNNTETPQGLALKARANKEIYVLGEPVTVEFEFINTGGTPAVVISGGVDVGSLKIVIANKDGEYRRYMTGAWGRLHGQKITLEANQSLKYSAATILWNGRPNVSHLNEDAAKLLLAGKITTEYAFAEPGVYFIKGLSNFGHDAAQIESDPIKIESEPIRIVIAEPLGDDLEVWNHIEGNREIAYLMQRGAFNATEEEEKQQLTSQVEQILVRYPNSVYSKYLKPNLEKYLADEAKRKKAYKDIKLRQKPQ